MLATRHDYIVAQEEQGQRIDKYLSLKRDLGLTRSRIEKLVAEGQVVVNGGKVKPSYKVKLGERILVMVPPPQQSDACPENIPLKVIYEDDDLMVVNKPRGMVVHPAAGNFQGTLVNALLYHCKNLSGIGGKIRPGIVHRLDKDTSGLIVVAKNDFTHQSLSKQFKDKVVLKKYVALVLGEVKQKEGLIETRIGRHPKQRKKMAVISAPARLQGRAAVTLYKVLEHFPGYTLLELTLKTGRTHQIRVHLHYLGHPVVGDPVYGGHKNALGFKQQLLHAKTLGFTHPRSGRYLVFECPLPEDMEAMIRRVRRK
jgi:23S rRNA pseudouridine1911/1915/1917 synthase